MPRKNRPRKHDSRAWWNRRLQKRGLGDVGRSRKLSYIGGSYELDTSLEITVGKHLGCGGGTRTARKRAHDDQGQKSVQPESPYKIKYVRGDSATYKQLKRFFEKNCAFKGEVLAAAEEPHYIRYTQFCKSVDDPRDPRRVTPAKQIFYELIIRGRAPLNGRN